MNLNELTSKSNASKNLLAERQAQAVSYSLKGGSTSSSRYYTDIKAFTNLWTNSLHPWLEEILSPVQAYSTANGLQQRSFDELALELLALGVTLQEHSAQADHMPTRVIHLLQFMIKYEQSHPRFEHVSKTLRGWINGLFSRPMIPRPGRGQRPLFKNWLSGWPYRELNPRRSAFLNGWIILTRQMFRHPTAYYQPVSSWCKNLPSSAKPTWAFIQARLRSTATR